jgi:hypothetical protein
MGLSAKLKATADLRLTGAPDLGTVEWKYPGHNPLDLANGSGNYQASKIYMDTKSIAASSSEDLDLAGSLVNPLGAAVVFATIKAIIIKAADTNVNNVVIGGASATQFQGPFGAVEDTIAIPPGGQFMISAPKTGWAVTGGSTDLLKLANSSSGSAVVFDVIILGT